MIYLLLLLRRLEHPMSSSHTENLGASGLYLDEGCRPLDVRVGKWDFEKQGRYDLPFHGGNPTMQMNKVFSMLSHAPSRCTFQDFLVSYIRSGPSPSPAPWNLIEQEVSLNGVPFQLGGFIGKLIYQFFISSFFYECQFVMCWRPLKDSGGCCLCVAGRRDLPGLF